MANRVLGNNTSFTFQTYNSSAQITSADWNTLVNANLQNMESVANRVPLINTGVIVGSIPSSVVATPGSAFVTSRHVSIVTSWNGLNRYQTSPGTHINDIVPKNVVSGPTVLNTWSNYWVFRTPGIYHINAEIEYNVVAVPAMIRIAIVPYVNDGVDYISSSPFDSTFTTKNGTMPVCLLAYTGKADNNVVGTKTASISGFVLVTSQTLHDYPGVSNIAVNSTNPLTAGNGYHIEIEGTRANAGTTPRFTITGGKISISLIQEWWK